MSLFNKQKYVFQEFNISGEIILLDEDRGIDGRSNQKCKFWTILPQKNVNWFRATTGRIVTSMYVCMYNRFLSPSLLLSTVVIWLTPLTVINSDTCSYIYYLLKDKS